MPKRHGGAMSGPTLTGLEAILGGGPSPQMGAGGGGLSFGYKPRETDILQALLYGLNQGMEPAQAFDVWQGVYQGALDRLATRRQTQQDTLSGLGSQLTDAALGGVGPQGLEALVGVQQAANPSLARPGMAGPLDQIVQNAGTLSQYAPTGEEEAGPSGLDPEETTAIMQVGSNAIATMAQQGKTDFQSVFWGGLARQLTQAGFVGEDFDRAKNLLRENWARLGGTFGTETTPAPSGPPAQPSQPGPANGLPARRSIFTPSVPGY